MKNIVLRSGPPKTKHLVVECELPNGLAFPPDERVLYVANTRHAQYIHAIELDAGGSDPDGTRGGSPNISANMARTRTGDTFPAIRPAVTRPR